MNAHRYERTIYKDLLGKLHKLGQKQDVLYVSGKFVVGFTDGKVNLFANDQEWLEDAQKVVDGTSNEEGVKYIGEVDISLDDVLRVEKLGIEKLKTNTRFERAVNDLIGKL